MSHRPGLGSKTQEIKNKKKSITKFTILNPFYKHVIKNKRRKRLITRASVQQQKSINSGKQLTPQAATNLPTVIKMIHAHYCRT